jgi:hypothetical protein
MLAAVRLIVAHLTRWRRMRDYVPTIADLTALAYLCDALERAHRIAQRLYNAASKRRPEITRTRH